MNRLLVPVLLLLAAGCASAPYQKPTYRLEPYHPDSTASTSAAMRAARERIAAKANSDSAYAAERSLSAPDALGHELAAIRARTNASRDGVVIAGLGLATAGIVGWLNVRQAEHDTGVDVKMRYKVPWISMALAGLVAAGAALTAGP
jgi:hypothetical protein